MIEIKNCMYTIIAQESAQLLFTFSAQVVKFHEMAMDTKKNDMYMANVKILHWGPNATYIANLRFGVGVSANFNANLYQMLILYPELIIIHGID